MAPPNTASPGEVKSTAPMPSPTLPVEAPSLVKRADHALTTPYVFPSQCTFKYEMMSTSRNFVGQFGEVRETILYIDIDAKHWQTCQPTGSTVGYLAGGGAASSVYRGAVCPSGWRAFNVGMASQQGTGYIGGVQTWSTAKCCHNTDALMDNEWRIHHGTGIMAERRHFAEVCVSTNTGTVTVSQTGFSSYSIEYWTTLEVGQVSAYSTATENGSTTTKYNRVSYITTTVAFKSGRAFYPPVSLEWMEEDNLTLSPKWPTLTSDMLIPTWKPKQNTSEDWLDEFNMEIGAYDNRGAGRREEVKQVKHTPSMPNKVAIPVIAVLASLLAISLGALIFLLWRGRKANRQGAGSSKIVDVHPLRSPMDGEAGSTAHLNGQAGDDMELRPRDVAR